MGTQLRRGGTESRSLEGDKRRTELWLGGERDMGKKKPPDAASSIFDCCSSLLISGGCNCR